MSDRFSYVKYDERSVKIQNDIKQVFEALEQLADIYLPNSRPKSLMITALEEAYMWAGKAIRDQQKETRGAEEQPERKDG